MGAYVVADASVFILGRELDGEVITVPGVERELRDIRSRMRLQISGVRVESPSKESLHLAAKAAQETGDISALSPADLEVLAKAMECSAAVATDDYAVQNVAMHMGLKIEPVVQRGIKKKLKWTQRCFACGRLMQGDPCAVCGTPARKRKKRG